MGAKIKDGEVGFKHFMVEERAVVIFKEQPKRFQYFLEPLAKGSQVEEDFPKPKENVIESFARGEGQNFNDPKTTHW